MVSYLNFQGLVKATVYLLGQRKSIHFFKSFLKILKGWNIIAMGANHR